LTGAWRTNAACLRSWSTPNCELSARLLGRCLRIALGNLLDLLIGVGDTLIAMTQFATNPVVGADGATALLAAVGDAM